MEFILLFFEFFEGHAHFALIGMGALESFFINKRFTPNHFSNHSDSFLQ